MPSSVPIPPWLNISPTAPVQGMLEGYRSGLSASQAQASNAARAQQQMLAQQQAAELNAYRQQQQELARAQFADVAANRMAQQQVAQQRAEAYQRALRLREQQVEKQAEDAARQMLAMRKVQEAIASGVPPQRAYMENAADLFANKPGQFASAMHALRPSDTGPLGPEAYTARNIVDERGLPIPGMRAIPGQRSARILPGARIGLSPEGEMRRLITLAAIQANKVANGKGAEREAAKLKLAEYEKQLEEMGKSKSPGAAPLPEDFDATGRVPGKEDELIDEEDFLLPPIPGAPEEE